ncbi:hypothetical protein OQA88_4393 [Cercophora sp. LCS_1]
MTNAQYSQGLAVFYPLYILAEVPSNLVLKRVTPRIWLAFMTFAWGVVCLGMGFIKNFSQFIAMRAILGLAEGGLFPGMVLYLSTIYTRAELALRIGVLYTATSLSGAFGGLLARALAEIGDRGGLSAWRWIFVIEGLFTVVVAFFTWLVLPNNITTAPFLTEEEREVGEQRLAGALHGTGSKEVDEKFSLSEVGRAFLSPQTWLTAGAYFGLLSGIYSFGLFLPTIIFGLGYTAHEAQLWSVPPYAVAACTTLFVAFIGYAAIANMDNHPKAKYGMTFLMATGIYSSVPCVLAWLSNNSAGHYKRATSAALQLSVANCGGILAVFLYPDVQGPSFHKGHTIVMSLLTFGWFLILTNVLYCAKINRDKARGKYNDFSSSGDDRDPEFKMVM